MKKFPVLHVIVWIFRILGVLALITALIAGIAGLVAGFGRGFGMMNRFGYGGMMGYSGGLGVFFSGLLGGILLYGAGEVIALLLAIEENTRSSHHVMQEKKELPAEPPANPS